MFHYVTTAIIAKPSQTKFHVGAAKQFMSETVTRAADSTSSQRLVANDLPTRTLDVNKKGGAK